MSNNIRLACDRCRASKLRCPRHESPQNNPCDRCTRAGTPCITSSARPLGRPRTKQAARGVSASTARAQAEQAKNGTTHFQISSISTPPSTFGMSRNMINTSSELVPTWLGTTSDHDLEAIDSLSSINVDFLNFQDPSLDGMFPPRLDMPDPNMHLDPVLMPSISENLFTSRTPETDAIIKLSQLNASIARHRAESESYLLCAPPASDQRLCAETSDEIEQIPLIRALQSASEFSDVLEWLQSDLICSSSSTSAVSSDTRSSPSATSDSSLMSTDAPSTPQATMYPFSKPIMLLILSNYIQTIELYNHIFSRVCDVIKQIPDTSEFFQLSTKFRVNGIPPMKAQLYIRFIIQATEDDLQTVERLMGLPEEFCISPPAVPARGVGIFSGASSLRLLRLVLGQTGSSCEKDFLTSDIALVRDSLKYLDTVLRC